MTASQLLTRGIAHLAVVGLVASASFAGIAQSQVQAGATARDPGFLPLVASVRGAADPTQAPRSTTFSLRAQPIDSTAVNRALPAQVPVAEATEPMATPVPVDPNATPLPAPTGVGQTATSSRGGSGGQPAPVAAGNLLWPVPAGSISQYYHAGHLALDVAASYGSQVVAAQAGVVTWAAWRNNGGGLVITIDHGNGMSTVYNHLGSIWVSPGQYVVAGQGIAGVGCTGLCTGPHVHFEVIVNGIIDNPLRYY